MSMLSRFASLSRTSHFATRRFATIIATQADVAAEARHPNPQAAPDAQSRPLNAVISLSGPDRPGIVNTVTTAITDHDANVEASRMALLGGDFAMILHIKLKSTQASDNLGVKLREAFPNFSVSLRETTAPTDDQSDKESFWLFTLEGPDHPGLISAVSQALAVNGSNVQEMNTESSAAPFAGYELFKINSRVTVDESRLDALSNALSGIEEKYGSTITLEKKA